MRIIALDDKPLQRRALVSAIREADPDAEVVACASAEEVLALDDLAGFDAAFIDIDMPGMSGIELARELRAAHPTLNVVFATAYAEYMPEAFELYSSGYVLKPVTAKRVAAEFANLRFPPATRGSRKLRVQCFGDFEVFAGGSPVAFPRAKAKELFAYLVNRRGAACAIADIEAVLWEGDETKRRGAYIRSLVHDVRATLDALSFADVLVKRRGEVGVAPDAIECDYYDYLAGDSLSIAAYQSEYMRQYSWAEVTLAGLEKNVTIQAPVSPVQRQDA